MFKSPAQRSAFFAAVKKKKEGLNNPAAAEPSEKPMKLEQIGQETPTTPPVAPPVAPPFAQPPSMPTIKIPKFAKLKKLMTIK